MYFLSSSPLNINIQYVNKKESSVTVSLEIYGIPIEQVTKMKFVSVTIYDKLCWLPHIKKLIKKLSSI